MKLDRHGPNAQGGEVAEEAKESFGAFKESHDKALKRYNTRETEYEEALKPMFESVLGLVQIATGGDPKKVGGLVSEPSVFFEKLLEDEMGLLRGFLMTRAMHEVATRPSRKDPLDWARLILELQIHSKELKALEAAKGRDAGVRGRKPESKSVVDDFLSRVGGPSDKN